MRGVARMTTIAYRDGVLAADTLTCWGDKRDGFCTKIAKRGPVLAAASGKIAGVKAFLDWFRGGMAAAPPTLGDGEEAAFGFIIPPGGHLLTYSKIGWELTRSDTLTAGSGGEFAAGAMSAGATPEQAVAIAIRHDTHSGGDIMVLRA